MLQRGCVKIGIFGGSFDPPHWGHVALVERVLSRGLADQVLVLPVFGHAFHKETTPFEHRLSLCQLAFAGNSRVTVSDLEKSLPAPSYTIQTVEALLPRFPGAEFRLLLGADCEHELARWHRSDELIRLAPPIYVARRGHDTVLGIDLALPEISSSEVRRLLVAHRAGVTDTRLEDWIPGAVLSAILERGLYRE